MIKLLITHKDSRSAHLQRKISSNICKRKDVREVSVADIKDNRHGRIKRQGIRENKELEDERQPPVQPIVKVQGETQQDEVNEAIWAKGSA